MRVLVQLYVQEGGNARVDLVNEAKLAKEGIGIAQGGVKAARREIEENGACDSEVAALSNQLTGVVDSVASTVAAVAELVKTSVEKQNEMTEMLAEMVNSTAAANARTTTNTVVLSQTAQAVANQLVARQLKKHTTCMEYKLADPTLKSGVYVLAAKAMIQHQNNERPEMKAYVGGHPPLATTWMGAWPI